MECKFYLGVNFDSLKDKVNERSGKVVPTGERSLRTQKVHRISGGDPNADADWLAPSTQSAGIVRKFVIDDRQIQGDKGNVDPPIALKSGILHRNII